MALAGLAGDRLLSLGRCAWRNIFAIRLQRMVDEGYENADLVEEIEPHWMVVPNVTSMN